MHRNIFKLIVLALLFASCSNGQQNSSTTNSETQTAVVENVDAKQMSELMAKHLEGIILDVRTPEEVANGHLANATTVNLYDDAFAGKVKMIRKDVPVFVYCAAGSRSAKAAEQMSSMGFTKIYNLTGGYNGWVKNGFPIVLDEAPKVSEAEKFTSQQIAVILKKNKSVLLDFHTSWCIPCKKMNPVIDELKKESSGKYFIQSIDADANKELVAEYKIESVPTFIVLQNGKEIFRHSGIIEKEILKSKLTQ